MSNIAMKLNAVCNEIEPNDIVESILKWDKGEIKTKKMKNGRYKCGIY